MAGAATIGFGGLDSSSSQSVPLMSFSEDGYSFDVASSGANAGAAVFDTDCPAGYGGNCNGDPDLQPQTGDGDVSGNALILQENGSTTVPDDDASGGTIELTLTSGTPFLFGGASAVDDGAYSFASTDNGALGDIMLADDNESGMVAFDPVRIDQGETISIACSDSGAVDNLRVSPVPVPAALPGLAAALGGLGFAARRRRRTA